MRSSCGSGEWALGRRMGVIRRLKYNGGWSSSRTSLGVGWLCVGSEQIIVLLQWTCDPDERGAVFRHVHAR